MIEGGVAPNDYQKSWPVHFDLCEWLFLILEAILLIIRVSSELYPI